MKRAGRPAGARSGFRLSNHRWRLAYAGIFAAKALGVSGKKAVKLIFAAFADPEIMKDRVTVELQPNGQLKIEMRTSGTWGESGTRRIAIAVNDGAGSWVNLSDFERIMRRIHAKAQKQGVFEADAVWLIEIGTMLLIALFGSDAGLRRL
jgi:hypothetical protein